MIGFDDKGNIKYLLPKFDNPTLEQSIPFDLNYLYDRSIRYLYDKYNYDYFHILTMQPMDFLRDVIKPTVKTRFYSTDRKDVFYRLDSDNDIQMRNINCDNMFNPSAENNLVIIDYNKGYFNKNTVYSLYEYIIENNVKFKRVFINTKPTQLHLFKELLHHLATFAEITIQLNEFEFEPVKTSIFNDYYWDNLVVTRGKKAVHLYKSTINTYNEFNISDIILDDMYTTSGCGDIFLANIIYNMIYNDMTIESSLSNLKNVKSMLIRLNNDLFNLA